jgi:hypothetical protein
MIIAPQIRGGLRRPTRSASQPSSGQPTTHPSGTIEAVVTAAGKLKAKSLWKNATPQTMAPTVVGTKSRPATSPHKYDCGLLKTIPYGRSNELDRPDGCFTGRSPRGMTIKRNIPVSRLAAPRMFQIVCHGTSRWIIGPTTDWPAQPPNIPRHCVTPIAVANRRAENPCVARYTAPVKAKAEPPSLK